MKNLEGVKVFTARQLNTHRQEIRDCIASGQECIVEFKDYSRNVELQAVLVGKDKYEINNADSK